jgi:hypothetical protein
VLSAVGSSASYAGERRFGDAAHSPWATAIHQPVGPSIQSRPCTHNWSGCPLSHEAQEVGMSAAEIAAAPTGTWSVDPIHSSVGFEVKLRSSEYRYGCSAFRAACVGGPTIACSCASRRSTHQTTSKSSEVGDWSGDLRPNGRGARQVRPCTASAAYP